MPSPPPLKSPLSLADGPALGAALRFPVQHRRARREVLVGAALLLVPFVGWLLNMGHRIQLVHQMLHGQPAWPAWHSWGRLLRYGAVTWLGMAYYYTPAGLCGLAAGAGWGWGWWAAAAGLFGLATVAIPGYMSHYCVRFDAREIFNPLRALRRVGQGGRLYWLAWRNVCVALPASFLGLLAGGLGFLYTSVWFWQSAGYSFASVFYHTALKKMLLEPKPTLLLGSRIMGLWGDKWDPYGLYVGTDAGVFRLLPWKYQLVEWHLISHRVVPLEPNAMGETVAEIWSDFESLFLKLDSGKWLIIQSEPNLVLGLTDYAFNGLGGTLTLYSQADGPHPEDYNDLPPNTLRPLSNEKPYY